jgi:hypothetical protein
MKLLMISGVLCGAFFIFQELWQLKLRRLLLEVDDISCLISVPLQILVDGGKCIELCRVLKTSTYMLYSHTILHFRCSISVPIWYHMFFFPTKRNY